MEMAMKKVLGLLLSSFLAVCASAKYSAEISLDKENGVYRTGDTVVCRVLLKKDGQPIKGAKARLVRKWESWDVKRTDFETTGEPVEFTYRSTRPGWVYFGVEVLGSSIRYWLRRFLGRQSSRYVLLPGN